MKDHFYLFKNNLKKSPFNQTIKTNGIISKCVFSMVKCVTTIHPTTYPPTHLPFMFIDYVYTQRFAGITKLSSLFSVHHFTHFFTWKDVFGSKSWCWLCRCVYEVFIWDTMKVTVSHARLDNRFSDHRGWNQIFAMNWFKSSPKKVFRQFSWNDCLLCLSNFLSNFLFLSILFRQIVSGRLKMS